MVSRSPNAHNKHFLLTLSTVTSTLSVTIIDVSRRGLSPYLLAFVVPSIRRTKGPRDGAKSLATPASMASKRTQR